MDRHAIDKSLQAVADDPPGTGLSDQVRTAPGARLVVEVSDNGRGIAEDLLNDIFVPFFTTKPGGGHRARARPANSARPRRQPGRISSSTGREQVQASAADSIIAGRSIDLAG